MPRGAAAAGSRLLIDAPKLVVEKSTVPLLRQLSLKDSGIEWHKGCEFRCQCGLSRRVKAGLGFPRAAAPRSMS